MSLENLRTGDKPSLSLIGEGRREGAGQQPAPPHRSGGVSVDGTFASSARVSWEVSGDGPQAQPPVQAGRTSKAGVVPGEVGVLHSSRETPVMGADAKAGHSFESQERRWPMAPQGDTPSRGMSSSTLTRSSPRQRGNRIEPGEPNMGNPSVRFDEGRSETSEPTTAVGSIRPFHFAYSTKNMLIVIQTSTNYVKGFTTRTWPLQAVPGLCLRDAAIAFVGRRGRAVSISMLPELKTRESPTNFD